MSITLIGRDSATLPALMLESLLQRRLSDPAVVRAMAGQRFRVRLRASRLDLTLEIAGADATLRDGGSEPADVQVRGTLDGLIAFVTGNGFARALLGGKLIAWGAPARLWALYTLFRIPDARE